MRTFLCGLPSSGATFVAWTMCQSHKTLGLLDMCQGEVPRDSYFPSRFDVLVKDTVGSGRAYEGWLERFKPDRVLIVTRDESYCRQSMLRRYREAANPSRFLKRGQASIDAICRESERIIGLNRHHEIIKYEQVVASNPELPRSLMNIAVQNHLHSDWCRWNALPVRWGFGGIHLNGMSDVEIMLLFRTIRYYGTALLGFRKWRHKFLPHGMYLPSVSGE
ncbi:MAG: hypothetical protein ACYTG0_25140 [Planctomycetota bacterium]|jgi:hypothetical protein